MLRDRCELGFFFQCAGQGGVKALSKPCSYLPWRQSRKRMEEKEKMLSFPLKQGDGYIPESVLKLLSDPECLETVKL